jgi:hypothetical protein
MAVAIIITTDIVENREVDEATWERLATAAKRIGEARQRSGPSPTEFLKDEDAWISGDCARLRGTTRSAA